MNHLEALIAEYLEWQGFFVRTNIQVGKRAKGGFSGELDIVAYKPDEPRRLLHIEPSLAALGAAAQRAECAKKFQRGREYILTEVFPWLADVGLSIEQFAVLPSLPRGENAVCDGNLMTVDELLVEIRARVTARGKGEDAAIPGAFPLLRTIQFAEVGYTRRLRLPAVPRPDERDTTHTVRLIATSSEVGGLGP